MLNRRRALFFFVLIALCAGARAERVKFLIMGDTQKIMDAKHGKQHEFLATMDRVLTDPVTRDAAVLLHMGDIVESDADNSDRPGQYAVAREGFRKLDGKLPYVLNVGNNDDSGEFQTAFPLNDYSDLPSFVGNYDGHNNVAHQFSAGGVDWLIVSLRFKAGEAEVKWAEKLIQEHADKNVVLINHEMNRVVETMARKHASVVFLLSGHSRSKTALVEGRKGHAIGWIKTCWHDASLDSFFCVVELDVESGVVDCRYYSPFYGEYGDDPSSALYGSARNPMTQEKGAYEHPWRWDGFDFK